MEIYKEALACNTTSASAETLDLMNSASCSLVAEYKINKKYLQNKKEYNIMKKI